MKNTYVANKGGITTMLLIILIPLLGRMYNITLYVIQASSSLLAPIVIAKKL
jgi:hypothetical protein